MKTTAATYQIEVMTDEGFLSVIRIMPTRPKTPKGIKSRNNELERWAMNQYPNWTEINIQQLDK